MTVEMSYLPPAGIFGAAWAKLTGRDPAMQIRRHLDRFKSYLEAGEAPTIEGQPRGQCA